MATAEPAPSKGNFGVSGRDHEREAARWISGTVKGHTRADTSLSSKRNPNVEADQRRATSQQNDDTGCWDVPSRGMSSRKNLRDIRWRHRLTFIPAVFRFCSTKSTETSPRS